jgi:hypothetical protein
MTTITPTSVAIYGLLAEFDGPNALLAAARRTRAAGYKRFDVFSPYPIHGMDGAMGLKRSKLGWLVAGCALAGAAVAMGMQWYCNVYDYPLITQGKPYFSWQAFLIVTFELTVLFSAFGAVGGMLLFNGLPRWYHPTLKHDRFVGASDNRFFLAIEAADPKYSPVETAGFLADLGAGDVVPIEE